MKPALRLSIIGTVILLLGSVPLLSLDPSLDVSQYAHTAWTARDGFSVGACTDSMGFPPFRGNHLQVSNSPISHMLCW
jgi:hypothetical protein